jgi:hypothetical protein
MVISDGADEEGRTGAGRTHRDLAGRAAAVLGQGNVSSADDAETLILYVYIFISPETPALHGECGVQRPAHERLVRRELLYPPARLQRPIVRQEGNATRATTNHRLHLAEWRRRAMALVVTGELGTLLFLGSIPLLSSLFISVYSTLPQFLVLSAIDPSYFCCRCRRARSLIRCDSIYVTKQTPHRASPL